MPEPYQSPYESIAVLLEQHAAATPATVYLITYDDQDQRRAFSYATFARRVAQAAGYLAARGVKKGERVATLLHNHPEAPFLMFGAWRLGAAVVPINLEETAARKRFILQDAEAVLLFALPEYLAEVALDQAELPCLRDVIPVNATFDFGPAEVEAAAKLQDEALIVYTSGTTGNPKGVVLSQYNLLADADAIASWFAIQPGERWMCVLPIHHVNGIVVTLLSPLYAGGGLVLNRRFSPRTFWPRAAAEGVSVSSLVPTLLEFLMEAGGTPPPTMRGVICGAGPLAVETVLRFEERFRLPVWHGYGLSETTAYACMTPADLPDEERRAWFSQHGFPTIGAPMPHQDLSIRDGEGRALPAGKRGEICITGSTIMQGYYRRPDANAEAFKFPGWFRSGDEGFWLEGSGGRPFFFITGRIKELIIRGGVNLSPLEIDAVLAAHPAVRFGMAVPFENRYYGEEVAAYAVLREGYVATEALAEEVRLFCAAQLPFAMQPKVVLFGQEVPYTSTGKPKRLELKRLLAKPLAEYREHQFREERKHGGG